MGYLRRCMRYPLLKVAQRMDIWSSVDGVRVGALSPDRAMGVRAKVRLMDALKLIRTNSPQRYLRICRDMRSILAIAPRSNRDIYATYTPGLRMCIVNAYMAANDSIAIEELAAVIVHEAAHARLWKRGVRHTRRVLTRIEYVCLKEEIVFLKRLSCTEDLVHAIERKRASLVFG